MPGSIGTTKAMKAVFILELLHPVALTKLYIASQDPTTGLRYLEPGVYTSTDPRADLNKLLRFIVKLIGFWPRYKISEVVGYD
jgi:hypothetical protein